MPNNIHSKPMLFTNVPLKAGPEQLIIKLLYRLLKSNM